MRRLALLAVLALMTGCTTMVTIETEDEDGNKIKTKLSESAYLADKNAVAMKALGEAQDPCFGLVPKDMTEYSASGQEAIGRAVEMCQIRAMVMGIGGRPVTPHGVLAAQTTEAIKAIEASDSAKFTSAMRTAGTLGGFWFGVKLGEAIADGAGDTITVDGVQQSNSINSSQIGALAEGEAGEHGIPTTSGDRSNTINIKSNTFVQDRSPSSAFSATANGDKPTAQEGPATGNNTLYDNDDVNAEAGLIPF